MKKIVRAALLLVVVCGGVIYLPDQSPDLLSEREIKKQKNLGAHPAALLQLFETYRDPATNSIPSGMRKRVQEYVKTLPYDHGQIRNPESGPVIAWYEAGPNDVGGRTRALAIDIKNDSTIIAGSVSGGIWKSTDKGESWINTTAPDQNPGVTTLAQDPREQFSHIWYYAAGEYRGNTTTSDRSGVAPYDGAGIYKSTDNGDSWELLPATADPNPILGNDAFDFVHRLVVSPESGFLFVASNNHGIYRSTDGGESFELVLGNIGGYTWNEVIADPDGTLVASLSSAGSTSAQVISPGIYVSADDGESWSEITPETFPDSHQRSIMANVPSSPGTFYVLTFTGNFENNGREDFRFHKINHLTGESEDRSTNLPDFPGNAANGPAVHSWFNFTMTLGVKPDDEDFVVVGGLNLFRSSDGFATPVTRYRDSTHIGGNSNPSQFSPVYPNHHVDSHVSLFNPNNPSEMWSAHDGGLSFTSDVTAVPLVWQSKNNGYNVTQFYSVSIARQAGDGKIIGGAQDNGLKYVRNLRPMETPAFTPAISLSRGDGSYTYVGEEFTYVSINFGDMRRFSYTNPQNTAFGQVSPPLAPPAATNQRFIHPYAVDPNDENTVYYPDGNRLFRSSRNPSDPLRLGWEEIQDLPVPDGYSITAIKASESPAHVLYFGASSFQGLPKLYRMENAHFSGAVTDISIPGAPWGAYVHDIAVNPIDANEILVVHSNYNITGLYHSADGGDTFTAVEGNLEGNNTLPGPSLRCAAILPAGSTGTAYLTGTSAGLFSTGLLDAGNTTWVHEGRDLMGSVIVEDIDSRVSDGVIAAGTHGRGFFWGEIKDFVSGTESGTGGDTGDFFLGQNFPNPFRTVTTVSYGGTRRGFAVLRVFDSQGQEVARPVEKNILPGDYQETLILEDHFPPGIFFYQLCIYGDKTKTSLLSKKSKKMVFLK